MLILLITYYGNEMWQEGCAYSFDTKLLARMHASSSSPRLPVSTCVTVSTPPSLTHSRRLLLRILSTVGSCEIPLLPIFFFFFPNNDRDRVYFWERRRGGYVSICRKGERGGECKANELGLDDRARCTRSVRSGRSFMHSGFFADNKIAASVSAVARCVGCIFSATLAIKWTTQYAFIWRVRGDG